MSRTCMVKFTSQIKRQTRSSSLIASSIRQRSLCICSIAIKNQNLRWWRRIHSRISLNSSQDAFKHLTYCRFWLIILTINSSQPFKSSLETLKQWKHYAIWVSKTWLHLIAMRWSEVSLKHLCRWRVKPLKTLSLSCGRSMPISIRSAALSSLKMKILHSLVSICFMLLKRRSLWKSERNYWSKQSHIWHRSHWTLIWTKCPCF